MKTVAPRDLLHNVMGRLFQARMWRNYALAWDGKPNSNNVDRGWCSTILKIPRDECLRRARINLRLAHRLNRRASMKEVGPTK